MKIYSICATSLLSLTLISCTGGGNINVVGDSPPDPNNPGTYNGNYYYAEATGEVDLFAVPNLPANVVNQVQWNSIALMLDTGTGGWTVAMNRPDFNPGLGHPVLMGPLSGIWTATPNHPYQYRVTSVNWSTGLRGDANPVNGGVPYDIFQPAAATGWLAMPANSSVNVCSVSTNFYYTGFMGGGTIFCSVEVMDMTTSEVVSSTVHLRISNGKALDNS